MTSPTNDGALAPARRNRARFAPTVQKAPSGADFTEAEVARGQSDAVLGALARMQLKLDVLTREHADSLARVEALLSRLDQKLTLPVADI